MSKNPFTIEDREEVRARLLCKMQGLDPDERVTCSHPDGYAVAIHRPRWYLARDELRQYRRLQLVTSMSVSACKVRLHDIEREEGLDRSHGQG